MRAACAREPVSTEDLFRAHAPFVARFLSRLGVWPDDLDDAVQEVFLVVHRNGGYLPGPATPTGYLASIALRAASSYRRRGRKSRNRRSDVAPDEVSSVRLDPARSLEVQQSLVELQGALDRLDPDLRATLVLAELEGESCGSIAAAMQIAVGTVYWRLHRARKMFRHAIEGRREAERHAQDPAAGVLFALPPAALLDVGRSHPGVGFDAESALPRLQRGLRVGASIPPWAVTATGVSSGVGLTAPAVLSALVALHAVQIGVSRWRAQEVGTSRPSPATLLASIAPEVPAEPAAVAVPPVTMGPTAKIEAHPADVAGAAPPSTRPGITAGAHSVQADPIGSPAPRSRLAMDPRVTPDSPTAANPPALAPSPSPPDATREIQEVASAQRILSSDPLQALSLVRSGEALFPSGYLREERHYIGVVALFKLGRRDEARAEAVRFVTDYPDGPFTARVRAASR